MELYKQYLRSKGRSFLGGFLRIKHTHYHLQKLEHICGPNEIITIYIYSSFGEGFSPTFWFSGLQRVSDLGRNNRVNSFIISFSRKYVNTIYVILLSFWLLFMKTHAFQLDSVVFCQGLVLTLELAFASLGII